MSKLRTASGQTLLWSWSVSHLLTTVIWEAGTRIMKHLLSAHLPSPPHHLTTRRISYDAVRYGSNSKSQFSFCMFKLFMFVVFSGCKCKMSNIKHFIGYSSRMVAGRCCWARVIVWRDARDTMIAVLARAVNETSRSFTIPGEGPF